MKYIYKETPTGLPIMIVAGNGLAGEFESLSGIGHKKTEFSILWKLIKQLKTLAEGVVSVPKIATF